MRFSLPLTTAGALPLTAYTVSVARTFFPKKPGTVTIQLWNVRRRPLTFETSLIWKTPARLVFGPCSGVPGDRRRGREQRDQAGRRGVGAGMEGRRVWVVERGRVAGEQTVRLRRPGLQRDVVRLVHELLVGPLFYRLLFSGAPLNTSHANQIVDAVMGAFAA
jgi:hypothetical protein